MLITGFLRVYEEMLRLMGRSIYLSESAWTDKNIIFSKLNIQKVKIMKKYNKQAGFTLIEILVVIGIIAILAAVVIVALNPARQFAQARDTQRSSNVNAILNAVWQRMVDSRGTWTATGGCDDLPATATEIATGAATAGALIDLEPCLVPTYLPSMVTDPSETAAGESGYTIVRAASGTAAGRITVSADAEIDLNGDGNLGNDVISVTR